METFMFGLGLIILGLGISLFLIVKLAKRRLKKSAYGNSFDFSKMPYKKISKKP